MDGTPSVQKALGDVGSISFECVGAGQSGLMAERVFNFMSRYSGTYIEVRQIGQWNNRNVNRVLTRRQRSVDCSASNDSG